MALLVQPEQAKQWDFGGLAFNNRRLIISGAPAAYTILGSQNRAIFLFDSAAGITYTLPATTTPGLEFDFIVTVSATSNSHKVITSAGTIFLIGEVTGYNTASSDAALPFHGNGSSHVAVTQAAASSNATGGLQGSWHKFRSVSSTLWHVTGQGLAGTTATTPFATS